MGSTGQTIPSTISWVEEGFMVRSLSVREVEKIVRVLFYIPLDACVLAVSALRLIYRGEDLEKVFLRIRMEK